MLLASIIVAVLLGAVALIALALHWRKGFTPIPIPTVGEEAVVATPLTPAGAVVINGELWPARSIDGLDIASRCRVRVVDFQDLNLMVEPIKS